MSSSSAKLPLSAQFRLRFIRLSAIEGPCARDRASSIVTVARSSSATTRLTRPSDNASLASTARPVKYSSRALAVPTSRVRKKLPPKSPENPTLTKAVTSLAEVPATRRSHARASASPAPAAGPLIIAIVGFGSSCKMRDTSIRERRCAVASAAFRRSPLSSAMLLTSPPAQKARPAPVRRTTLTAGSPPSRGSPSSSPCMIGVDSAFSRSGRLKVSVATPSSIVSRSSGGAFIFSSIGTISRGQQAFETASDDCLSLDHDPFDQFLAGRNVVDQPGNHAATPGARIELAVLQDAVVPRTADEVANVFDRCGCALVALDSEDCLDSSIGQYALGIAQRPHDQARL